MKKNDFFDYKRVLVKKITTRSYNVPWPYLPDKLYPEFSNSAFVEVGSTKNEIYDGVRELLRSLLLDKKKIDKKDWHPFNDYVEEGQTVVIKPNFVRHFNETKGQSLFSVIVHFSVLRPLIDYALLSAGKNGKVLIAEASQSDCNINIVKKQFRLDEIEQYYKIRGYTVKFIDTRAEFIDIRHGVVLSHKKLIGDPAGYTIAKVNVNSEFYDEAINSELLRGVDYEFDETQKHHRGNVHEYCISKTIMSADFIINVPKIKTHYKIGTTLALKNLVGINGDKNWLPHWSKGFINEGGDQFNKKSLFNVIKSNFLEFLSPFLKRKAIAYAVYFLAMLFHTITRKRNNFGAGTWFGNDTIWRTTLDLNKVLFYFDVNGETTGKIFPNRKYLTICDGIIAGEGKGPMGPKDKPIGVLAAAKNPAYCDLVLSKLMGYDYLKIRYLKKLFDIKKLPLIKINNINELRMELIDEENIKKEFDYNDIPINYNFEAPPRWKNHIEL